MWRSYSKQVCVQLPTPAVNVTLLNLLLSAGLAPIRRQLLPAGRALANPQQRNAAAGWDSWTDGRTDGLPTVT